MRRVVVSTSFGSHVLRINAATIIMRDKSAVIPSATNGWIATALVESFDHMNCVLSRTASRFPFCQNLEPADPCAHRLSYVLLLAISPPPLPLPPPPPPPCSGRCLAYRGMLIDCLGLIIVAKIRSICRHLFTAIPHSLAGL